MYKKNISWIVTTVRHLTMAAQICSISVIILINVSLLPSIIKKNVYVVKWVKINSRKDNNYLFLKSSKVYGDWFFWSMLRRWIILPIKRNVSNVPFDLLFVRLCSVGMSNCRRRKTIYWLFALFQNWHENDAFLVELCTCMNIINLLDINKMKCAIKSYIPRIFLKT